MLPSPPFLGDQEPPPATVRLPPLPPIPEAITPPPFVPSKMIWMCYSKDCHLQPEKNLPVDANTSYGLIAYRHTERGVEVLAAEKAASIAFICLLTGQYSNVNGGYFMKLLSNTTYEEAEVFMSGNYNRVLDWVRTKTRFTYYNTGRGRGEMSYTRLFSTGSEINPYKIYERLLRDHHQFHPHPEWEFPKGRRSSKDPDVLTCAVREFFEELSMDEDMGIWDLDGPEVMPEADTRFILDPKIHFEEFVGMNNLAYSTVYYTFNAGHDFMNPLPGYDCVECYNCEMAAAKWVTIDEFSRATATFKPRRRRIEILRSIGYEGRR